MDSDGIAALVTALRAGSDARRVDFGLTERRRDGKRAELELVGVVPQDLLVDVLDRADAAPRDIAHDEFGAVPVAHAPDLIHRVVHLVADAARGYLGHRAARRLGEARVHQVRAQVARWKDLLK